MRPVLRVSFERREELARLSGGAINYCYQCGTCTATCPLAPAVQVRRMLRYLQLGALEPAGRQAWACVTCRLCALECPHRVDVPRAVWAARRKLYEARSAPERADEVLWSLYEEGNPLGLPRRERLAWSRGLRLSPRPDVLVFACCVHAYDPRLQRALRLLVRLLAEAGYSVGVARDLVCCGDAAYQVGEEGLFEELAKANAEAIEASGAGVVVATSPHTLYALRELYPRYGARLSAEVVHYSQLLARAVDEGRLAPPRAEGLRVTYHDPCYLGRWSGVYDEPRRLLRSVEGLELVEMPRSRERSLCCGGGGGGFWLENREARRLARARLEEARSTGASAVATACPYCVRMLEDEERVARTGLRVLDVVELLARPG